MEKRGKGRRGDERRTKGRRGQEKSKGQEMTNKRRSVPPSATHSTGRRAREMSGVDWREEG